MARKLIAYEEFVQSTGELDHLLAVRPASPLVRRTDEAVKLENVVHRACLVLLVAHFEGFAKAVPRVHPYETSLRPCLNSSHERGFKRLPLFLRVLIVSIRQGGSFLASRPYGMKSGRLTLS